MSGQATVTVNENQWAVSLATTYAELEWGLSGVPSMPAGTGMLFVLPADRSVSVTTEPMLFNIDIIFISSGLEVVDVARNVTPGNIVTEGTPVRYFLEVNAGEAEGVEVGDSVIIQGAVQPTMIELALPILVATVITGGVVAILGKGILWGIKKEGSSSSPKHHSVWLTPEQRKDLQEKYGSVAVRWAEEATKPGDVKGLEVAAEYYYKKLREVFGLGHLSPELTEEQLKRLREVLGLTVDVGEILRIHRMTGYVP